MELETILAFGDELRKIAGIFPWGREEKVKTRVNYHFSPKAGSDRWDKFLKNVSDPQFLKQFVRHPDADDDLVQHARSLHNLSKAKTVGKVYSSRLPGRSYEVRELQDGNYGCTCPDWRYVGTLQPGYECKHIRALKAGRVKAED